jgi:hypothetical protein
MTPRPYAADTTVPVEKSRAELDMLLQKHGATQRGIMCDDDRGLAVVAFVLGERQYRLELPLPREEEFLPIAKKTVRTWYTLTEEQRRHRVRLLHQQAGRSRWRALVMLVKSKLELVRIGASTVEREFLADLVLPGGETLARRIDTEMHAILKGEAPRLLGMGEAAP